MHQIEWFIFSIVIFIYVFLASTNRQTKSHNSPLILSLTINNISIYINSSNFTSALFKVAYNANLCEERKVVRSSSYISMYIFQKVSNLVASDKGLLSMYKLQFSPKCFIPKPSEILLAWYWHITLQNLHVVANRFFNSSSNSFSRIFLQSR